MSNPGLPPFLSSLRTKRSPPPGDTQHCDVRESSLARAQAQPPAPAEGSGSCPTRSVNPAEFLRGWVGHTLRFFLMPILFPC